MSDKNINYGAIIEARMSSSRLPGKVMLDLCGAPVIARMMERVKLSSLSDYVVVATTTDDIDEVICNTCVDYGIDFYRGNPKDLYAVSITKDLRPAPS